MFVYHVVVLYYDCFVQLLIINEMVELCLRKSNVFSVFTLMCHHHRYHHTNECIWHNKLCWLLFCSQFKLSSNLTNVQYGCQLRPQVCTETDNKTESWLPEEHSQTLSCIPSVFHIDTPKINVKWNYDCLSVNANWQPRDHDHWLSILTRLSYWDLLSTCIAWKDNYDIRISCRDIALTNCCRCQHLPNINIEGKLQGRTLTLLRMPSWPKWFLFTPFTT